MPLIPLQAAYVLIYIFRTPQNKKSLNMPLCIMDDHDLAYTCQRLKPCRNQIKQLNHQKEQREGENSTISDV